MLLLLFVAYALALSIALGYRGWRPSQSVAATPPGTAAGAPRILRILIVGATGGTGRQLMAQALERGYEVTALVRRPETIAMEHPRLTVKRGDVLDGASLDAAVRGQDAVVSALGHKQFYRPTRIQSAGTANLLAAMAEDGVRRFVCETSLGLGDSAGRMGLLFTFFVIPFVLPFYFWDKARQERVIAASAADWVIVRPGALTNGPRRGRCRHGATVGNVLWGGRISRADVADFMLNQLESDTYLRTAPGICW